jgi:hypothetical protein
MPYVESGEFNRDTAYIQDRITRDGRDGLDRRAAAPVARPAV